MKRILSTFTAIFMLTMIIAPIASSDQEASRYWNLTNDELGIYPDRQNLCNDTTGSPDDFILPEY